MLRRHSSQVLPLAVCHRVITGVNSASTHVKLCYLSRVRLMVSGTLRCSKSARTAERNVFRRKVCYLRHVTPIRCLSWKVWVREPKGKDEINNKLHGTWDRKSAQMLLDPISGFNRRAGSLFAVCLCLCSNPFLDC